MYKWSVTMYLGTHESISGQIINSNLAQKLQMKKEQLWINLREAQIINQILCLKTQILNKRNLVNHHIEALDLSINFLKRIGVLLFISILIIIIFLGSPISSSSHKDLSCEDHSLPHSSPLPSTASGWPSSYSQCGCADTCHRSTPHCADACHRSTPHCADACHRSTPHVMHEVPGPLSAPPGLHLLLPRNQAFTSAIHPIRSHVSCCLEKRSPPLR
ncbi:hypothetical protein MJO28_013408 [Puccinia striiformis f. sp. tritici]|uniref:Uncharacterized protein n=1 Tax=Puccinia striiformis f. sp. tritici TaxID=168172 RepID=A0ACC0E047_9BASI|nr:hypothetical protein MJO28_013408 [Puccinia striiformis f. sp. tritici]